VNNKIVARFADGSVLKGSTSDFVPTKPQFHVAEAPHVRPVRVLVADLKALFFVKDLDGKPERKKQKEFDPARVAVGRKIKVIFADGETLLGTTQGYQAGRPGFFMTPADVEGNTERCYVVAAATKDIVLL
jgi:hypothetical protein